MTTPNQFEVRAYSKTGMYSEIVSAPDKCSAKAKAMMAIRKYAFGKILVTLVNEVSV